MKGIKLSQLISFRRLAAVVAMLGLIVFMVIAIGPEKISLLFPKMISVFPWALLFLFLSYLLKAQATSFLMKKRKTSLLALLRLKIVCDAYNKISYLAPFRGDTIFRKTLDTDLLIQDRGLSGIASFFTATLFLLLGILLSLPLPSFVGLGIGLLSGLLLLKGLLSGYKKNEGPYRRLRTVIKQIGLSFLVSRAAEGRLEEADRSLIGLLREDPQPFWSSFVSHTLSNILFGFMVFWLGKGIGTLSVPQALFLTGLIPLISHIVRFLPGSLGSFEGCSILFMALFYGSEGMAAGFLIAIGFRLVTLTGRIVGLVIGGNPAKILFR